ncbi:membrane-bound lytic murein transglycosylase MltF [Sulfidibacter corallicola]|uniref:Membrane-bound lytic murein transglycosylase MltF n=1 Tax=Sulfidibacter corallicola TaxID=2818388 RepID=A0A8A4TS40_SULCO|nr:membrane-bound lytic murein transglycosylase MltF [Sulfidibacter corallicola]QTD52207.1 membrane-bound lytic murein transglycosylase MltF [Sulfidibacter corallicola]
MIASSSLKNRRSAWLLVLVVSVVFGGMSACWWGETPLTPMERLHRDGELVVLTRNAPTMYYERRDRWEGFEYELASAFAAHLGLKPRFVVKDTTAEILAAIQAGEGHIAAAGLTHTAERARTYLFGPPYQTVQQQVVGSRRLAVPEEPAELVGASLLITGSSSYEEELEALRQQVPRLTWTSHMEMSTEQMLEEVWSGNVDFTIGDSHLVSINRRYFPELRVAFPIGEEQSLAWVVNPEMADLLPELAAWFAAYQGSGALDGLKERYYGYVKIFDYVDTRTFRRKVERVLPRYEALFRDQAVEHGFPWTLLAAQAYQESHWNPNALSPTGVRGIMMLTKPTAEQLGVEDRADPAQSIQGGVRYLTGLHKRVPETVQEPDRTWMALAAYNVGFGHLMDARELAVRAGKNPDLWRDLKHVLPQLSQRKYYKTVKHGYARGSEPVRYVQNIRNYQNILERLGRMSPDEDEPVTVEPERAQ